MDRRTLGGVAVLGGLAVGLAARLTAGPPAAPGVASAPAPPPAASPTRPALVLGAPESWRGSHFAPADYALGTDRVVFRSPPASAFLRAAVPDPHGAAWLEQQLRADAYRGARARLSGAVQAAGVAGAAGLWLRADGWDGPLAAALQPATGSHGWARHAVVLDVPVDAVALLYGLLLQGRGRLWADDLRLEPVGADVSLTETPLPAGPVRQWTHATLALGRILDAPHNLDFDFVRR